jgi:hypothetical protein
MSDYGFVHDGKVFTPNGTTNVSVTDSDTRNKAMEQGELAEWQTAPDRFLAYYRFPTDSHTKRYQASWRAEPSPFAPDSRGAIVTTWLGTKLGDITSARVYRHNFGSRMVAITVKATNGATYHGRASWDHGECITLRKSK